VTLHLILFCLFAGCTFSDLITSSTSNAAEHSDNKANSSLISGSASTTQQLNEPSSTNRSTHNTNTFKSSNSTAVESLTVYNTSPNRYGIRIENINMDHALLNTCCPDGSHCSEAVPVIVETPKCFAYLKNISGTLNGVQQNKTQTIACSLKNITSDLFVTSATWKHVIDNSSVSLPATAIFQNETLQSNLTTDINLQKLNVFTSYVRLQRSDINECKITHHYQWTLTATSANYVPTDLSITTTSGAVVDYSSVNEGTLLTCSAAGVPYPSFSWSYYGTTVSYTNVLTLNTVGNNLEYTCFAKNSVGTSSISVILNVLAATVGLSITTPSGVLQNDETVNMGTILTCAANGLPVFTYWWTNAIGATISSTNTLTMNAVGNDLKFTCYAQNTNGRNFLSVFLNVEGAPFNFSITSSGKSVTNFASVNVGTVLSCLADGLPAPTYWWTDADGATLTPSNTLTLNTAGTDLQFTCNGQNFLGKNFRSVFLTVVAAGLEAGAIVGIVLGSIAGFFVLLGLIVIMAK